METAAGAIAPPDCTNMIAAPGSAAQATAAIESNEIAPAPGSALGYSTTPGDFVLSRRPIASPSAS